MAQSDADLWLPGTGCWAAFRFSKPTPAFSTEPTICPAPMGCGSRCLPLGWVRIGGFLYYFVIKALNADIDEKYRKIKYVQFLCGIFTVAIALTIHTWVATMAWFATCLGPRIGAEIRTVPGGHVSFIVQAERYLDLMETFLQRNGI